MRWPRRVPPLSSQIAIDGPCGDGCGAASFDLDHGLAGTWAAPLRILGELHAFLRALCYSSS